MNHRPVAELGLQVAGRYLAPYRLRRRRRAVASGGRPARHVERREDPDGLARHGVDDDGMRRLVLGHELGRVLERVGRVHRQRVGGASRLAVASSSPGAWPP